MINKKEVKISILFFILGPFVLVILAIIPLSIYTPMETLPVPQSDLEKIKLDMPKESVENILGTPNEIENELDGELWRYGSDRNRMRVDIHFDPEGTVESIEIDH